MAAMSAKHHRRPAQPRPIPATRPHPGVTTLADQVRAGTHDAELAGLIDAINARTGELAKLRTAQALARLSLHRRVVISADAKPQYLRGQTGEIHEIDGDIVVVCLDKPVGRFTSGHVRCPPGLLVPLEI
jgi:hypothetical protein